MLLSLRSVALARPLSGARATAARRLSSVVDGAWLRAGGAGARKLLVLDCEPEGAYRRAHIPGALPFLVAPSGLKVRWRWPRATGEMNGG